MKIAVFYHCLFVNGNTMEPIAHASTVAKEQMLEFKNCGLLDSCNEFHVGVNGWKADSGNYVDSIIPQKAKVTYHGLPCRNECRTIVMVEEFAKSNPDWLVLYFHTKGATHQADDLASTNWRRCMMRHNVTNWRQCVADLESGYDSVGVHWMSGPTMPHNQSIWAGTFFWATSNFLATLPSLRIRDRVAIQSGIDSPESRYEAEVWIGYGPRLPKVKDYHVWGSSPCQ